MYVDTLFVCSATAFMVLITGTYNVTGPDGAQVFTGLANISAGTGFTQAAMEQVLPGFGSMFVAVALFFFAFTTVIAYYYIRRDKRRLSDAQSALGGLDLRAAWR